ncbi:MAG: TlpA disulfide reductase family protein [Syntrophobacteraceae bacterium]
MKRSIIFFRIIVCSFIILLQSQGVFCAQPAEEFPAAKFTLPAPDSSQAQKYLGLKAMEPFKVSDIKAKLAVIEFMSAFCPYCHANAPILNNIYKTIQGDSGLADVKVIAIAVGNEKAAVEAYKKQFKVPFPVLPDQDFAISVSMNGVPTPTTMIVSTENGTVLFSHTGVIQDRDGFVKQLKALNKKK